MSNRPGSSRPAFQLAVKYQVGSENLTGPSCKRRNLTRL